MSTSVHPRIIVTLSQGLIESVVCDNAPDVVGMQLILIDEDTEGADRDELRDVGDQSVFFSVGEVEQADDQTSRSIASAYDNWALEE